MSDIQNDIPTKSIFLYLKKLPGGMFLLFMSITKTLSSNYIPLLILFIVIFGILIVLSKRVLVLPCLGCSNGSWWYKCMKKTGYGSNACKRYIFITNTFLAVYNFVTNIHSKFYYISLAILNHKIALLKRWVGFVDDVGSALILLMPQVLIFKYFLRLVLPPLIKVFKWLINFIKSFKCAFTLPVINETIDICKAMATILSALINIVHVIFKTIINIFKLIFTSLFTVIIKPIFSQLFKIIKQITGLLTKSMGHIGSTGTQVIEAINEPIKVVYDFKIGHYFIIIFEQIMNVITKAVPFLRIFGSSAGTIIIFLTLCCIFILICIPLMGGFLACFSLIKAMTYLILGCDDDDDFLFLLLNIFNFIFGTNYGKE